MSSGAYVCNTTKVVIRGIKKTKDTDMRYPMYFSITIVFLETLVVKKAILPDLISSPIREVANIKVIRRIKNWRYNIYIMSEKTTIPFSSCFMEYIPKINGKNRKIPRMYVFLLL